MEKEREALCEDGYAVLENWMRPDFLELLRGRVEDLFVKEGARAGWEFKAEPQCRRLANLVGKGEIFIRAISHPFILRIVEYVLGPDFKLSSLNARSANPHSDWIQPLHSDMGLLPDEKGYSVCNTIWMLDDFTPQNGATRIVPGSHRFGKLPQQVLADPSAPHPGEILLTGKAGSVVVINAHAWHGGTANHTAFPRRALHAFYCRRDKPQQQYQKRLLNPELQRRLTPELRRLLALDDALNDRLCSETTGQSGFLP